HEAEGPVAEVNAAVVPGSSALLPGETPMGQPGRESAEAIVARKSVKADGAKGRTEGERSDPVEDIEADEAGRRGRNESRHGGKHGNVQE
ncbi:MAG: hypothetical protein AAB403_17440, partial [Planctomycetota bacterium]